MGHQGCESATRFGALVHTYRREAGLTQQELAGRAGLSVAAVRDFEQSRRLRPRRSSVAALADALSLDHDQTADLARAAAPPRLPRDAGQVPPSRPPQNKSARRADAARPDQGLWLTALGPLEAWRDGAPLSLGPPARRAVLGLLLLQPGVPVRRDRIIDLLWGEKPPRTAVGLVQAHVSRLRRVLQPRHRFAGDDGIIDSARGAYRLNVPSHEVDLLVFKDLAQQADTARAAGDAAAACDLYERALRLWQGDPLADVDLPRAVFIMTPIRQQLVDVLLQYADVACGLGWYPRVLPRLQALAAAEPLNEQAHARLMIALAGSGQQAAALRVYEDLRLRLDRELGLYPAEELADAQLRVLRQNIRAVHPVPAPALPPPLPANAHVTPRQLPAAVRFFTGRRDELETLSGWLQRDSAQTTGVVITALTGMAGVGKTALALHWAHQADHLFPDGQLFADLHGFSPGGAPVTPSEVIRGFLGALGVQETLIPADTAGQAALYRSLLAGRCMLIVLDNAQDAEQVRSLLPGSPGCVVLVTSRNRLTGLAAAEGAHLLALDVLTKTESRALLTGSLGAARAKAEPAAVSELIGLCTGLPLALGNIAAQAVARPSLPLAALAAEMRDERGRLDALETGEPATSVRAAFSWSLMRPSAAARWLFRLLGMYVAPAITVPAAASLAGLPRSQAYRALAELCDEHLLTEQPSGRYACNGLLRAYAAETSFDEDSDADRMAAIGRVLDHYLHTADQASAALYSNYTQLTRTPRPRVVPEEIGDPGQAAEWFKAERHGLRAAVGLAVDGGYAPHAWELPWAVGPIFSGRANWRWLATAQESALAVARKAGDLAGQALARFHLGLLTSSLGDHADAFDHLDEAMKLAWQAGDKQLYTLASLARVNVLRLQHRTLEALA
jgi:DNA-binding SARP family transcriptional activator/DNA-binding XRE family transcriptional regulator